MRLADGTTGWVKSTFLTANEPAVVRLKHLQDELDRSRATTPALAEAAARSEVERLKLDLSAKQSELDAARAGSVPQAPPTAPQGAPKWPVIVAMGVVAGLAAGFWLGYATLARRVRGKFGGLKVY